MREFIEYVAKYLVDNPEEVVVEDISRESDETKVKLALRVGASDIGKVIGKQGKTAQSLRTLLTAIAAKEGKKAVLEIIDK